MSEQKQMKRILKVAEEKFHRFGIRRVSMDEIARELRMSKKSLYRYFSSKEELVEACVRNIAEQIIPRLNAGLDDEGSPKEKIEKIWHVFALLPRFVSAEFAADLAANYPHLWEEIDRQRQKIVRRFETLIREGVASGEIQEAIHPKVMARLLTAIINDVFTPKIFALGEFSTEQAVRTIITLFSSGLFQRRRGPKDKGVRR